MEDYYYGGDPGGDPYAGYYGDPYAGYYGDPYAGYYGDPYASGYYGDSYAGQAGTPPPSQPRRTRRPGRRTNRRRVRVVSRGSSRDLRKRRRLQRLNYPWM